MDKQSNLTYLKKDEIATIVRKAICFYENEKYQLNAWVIMPNHVHLLLKPNVENKLKQILQQIKSYTGKEINKFLKIHGTFWQNEGFDHWVRPGKLLYWQNYIINNPVKAGLCKSPEEWIWSSAYKK